MKKFLVQLILVLSTKSESSKVTDEASSVANSEFQYRVLTSVVWWLSDPKEVTDFLTKYQGSVKTIDINTLIVDETIAFRQAVLFITTYDEFFHFIKRMDTNIMIPSKVIMILTNFKQDSLILSTITGTAWEHDITDLIIMNYDDTKQIVEMYTYLPYSNGNNCGNTSPVRLEYEIGNLFPRKFNNFYGCELRLGGRTVLPYYICINQTSAGGISGVLHKVIAERLNAKQNLTCMKEADSPMRSLIDKKIDAYQAVFVEDIFYTSLQIASVQYFCEIAWCGPPQREVYAWAKVIFPMISNITALLGAAFLVFAAVLKIIHRVEPCKGKKKNPQIFWQTLAIFLGQQANYVSSSTLRNVLFLLWIWFSLIVSLIYQGVLVQGLQTKHLEPRFGTLENAIQSLDAYGGSILMQSYYNGTSIGDNFEVVSYPTAISYIPEIARGKRFLLVTDKSRMKAYQTLQFLDKSVIHLPMAVLIRPRWAAAAEIDSLIFRTVENGFQEKLFRDEEMEIKHQIMHSSSQWSVVSLDLVTLSTCFYGLAIMYLVCFTILCVEIFYDWLLPPRIKGVLKPQNLKKSHL